MFLLWACASVGGADVPSAGPVEPVVAVEALRGCPEQIGQLVGDDLKDDARLLASSVLVIAKADRRILHYSGGRLLRDKEDRPFCFRVGLGFAPQGHKQQEGDGRTPEGWYRTSDKPTSQFYGAIAVHYPNEQDAKVGVTAGRITAGQQAAIEASLKNNTKPPQRTALGGEILVHGGGGETDWTLGCVALENGELDRLRASLPSAMQTQVLIVK